VGSFINRGPTSAGIMQGFGPGNPSSPVGNNRGGQSMYRFADKRGQMSGAGMATKFNPNNAYYNKMVDQAIAAGTVAVTPDGTGLMYRKDGTPINSASETMTTGQQAIANNQNQGPYNVNNYKKEDARPPPTGIEAIDILGQRLKPDGTLMSPDIATFTVPTGGTGAGVISESEEEVEESKGLLDKLTEKYGNIEAMVGSVGSRVEALSKRAGFEFGSLRDAYNWTKENAPNLLDTNFTPEEVIQLDAVNSQKVTLPGTVTGVGNVGDPPPADTTAVGSGGLYDIPSLTAIRSAVPGTYDSTRRPGSGGQRYFSDIEYVNNVEDPTAQRAANLAAQGRTDRQALGLAALNAANPAFQTRPSNQTLNDAQVFDMFTKMGQNPNLTTERQQIEQAVGMMNRYNVSPERLSEIMNVPLADIRERMGAYYTPYGEETDTYQSIRDLINNSTSARPKEDKVTTQQDKVDSIVADMTPATPVTTPSTPATPATPATAPSTPATPVATPGFTLPNVSPTGEYSQADIDVVLAGLANGDTTIDELSTIYDTPALDIMENTILDQGRTPAQAAALGGITEEDLVTQLINAGKTNPAEVLAYYQANTPEGEDFSNTTVTDVENYLNRNLLFEPDAITGEYGPSDVNAVINALQNDSVEVEDLSNLYGIPADDILANLASMGFGPDGEFIPLAQGGDINQYYLGGPTDGMADDIPAMIGNSQPAALSDGEFVIPADVVSHLGNGNSDAGAQNLYSMMDRVRTDRTGNPNQGKQIDPNQYLA